MSLRSSRVAGRICVALICAVSGCGSEPADSSRPRNLLLISLDTLVPGRMSAYGGPRQTTPNIDTLVRRGIRFTNARSTSPWTLPAHTAMLLGRYPTRLAPDPNDMRLYKLAPSLAKLFRDEGFRTAAVTGGAFLAKRLGIAKDFELFAQHARWTDRNWNPVERAEAFLEQIRDQPFFLFFHTYEVHVAYEDRRYADRLDPGRLESIFRFAQQGMETHRDMCCGEMEPTEVEREFLMALYDGGVAKSDETVRDLLAVLSRLGLAQNTAVVITSDHGEEFREHTRRTAYHGHSLYDELLRVPMIWYEPGLERAGQTQSELVSLLDIVPTAVARFELSPPAELDGVDLSPLIDRGFWTHERVLYGEGVKHGPPRFSVMTEDAKLIVTPDTTVQNGEGANYPVSVRAPRELYLRDDPLEQNNRIDDGLPILTELETLLARHQALAAKTKPARPVPELDRDSLTRLQELGYLQ
ncbi:MAG: sulfatase [Myxococcota bacterium]